MAPPISFTVRPPPYAPNRPSPLGTGGGRSGPPSRRFFEQNNGDDDEDIEEEYERHDRRSKPKEERIDGFSKNGRAVGYVFYSHNDRTETNRSEKVDGPMVIPALPNKDWRNSTRRTPSYRPEERRRDVEEDIKPDRIGDEPQKSGLSFVVKKERVEDTEGVEVKREQEESVTIDGNAQPLTTTQTTTVKSESTEAKPMTLEEQALQAILTGDHSVESASDRAQRELIIRSEADRLVQPISETDALQRDLNALPEVSTGDDYRNIPVEAFGMAMLRGMGYNPNDDKNTKIHLPKSRPGQLGLGATPMSEIIPPSHDKKSKREDRAKRGGRGFNASGVMIKKEINGNGSASGSVTPTASSSSRRPSPEYDSDASKRRRRDDEAESSRSERRRDDRDRDSRGERYETEDERARRKAKERERERDRDRGDRYETEEERARRKAKERERDNRDRDDKDRRR
jgi:hypothetical protein